MNAKDLTNLEAIKGAIPKVEQKAIEQIVPTVRKNYAELTGRNMSRTFFYRSAGISDDARPSLFSKVADFVWSISFANRQQGEILRQASEMIFDAGRDLPQPLTTIAEFWRLYVNAEHFLQKGREAFLDKNGIEMLTAFSNLKTAIDKCLMFSRAMMVQGVK